MSMTTLNIRIDSKIKDEANKTFNKIGLDMSSAVKLFLHQVINEDGLPFKPITKSRFKMDLDKQIEEALKGKGYKSAEEMHSDILGKNYKTK